MDEDLRADPGIRNYVDPIVVSFKADISAGSQKHNWQTWSGLLRF
jgi:hypothetical protein